MFTLNLLSLNKMFILFQFNFGLSSVYFIKAKLLHFQCQLIKGWLSLIESSYQCQTLHYGSCNNIVQLRLFSNCRIIARMSVSVLLHVDFLKFNTRVLQTDRWIKLARGLGISLYLSKSDLPLWTDRQIDCMRSRLYKLVTIFLQQVDI